MKPIAEQILDVYDARACWICGKPGLCAHREGRVEAAEIEAYTRKQEFMKGKLEAPVPSWAEAAGSACHAAKPSPTALAGGGENGR